MTQKLQVPTTFVGLEKWIQELWQQKETQLQKFRETQEFMPLTLEQRLPRTSTTLQVISYIYILIFYEESAAKASVEGAGGKSDLEKITKLFLRKGMQSLILVLLLY